MGLDVVGATTNLIDNFKTFGSNYGGLSLDVPAPNILSNYASYSYVIGLHPLTTTQLNFPDSSYIKGESLPIICQSGMGDPINRVQTPNFGKQDFFINNLTFETYIGHTSPATTNIATLQFDIIEPYSIGLFINTLQAAAYQAGHNNWREAPFLLSIQFRGNTQNGMMKKVPFSTRYVPFKFATITMNSSDQGTKYLVNAFAIQSLALTEEFAKLRSDVTIKGKTVQEVLQTGKESLQNVINEKLAEAVTSGIKKVPDKIVIVFPKEITDSKATAAAAGADSQRTNTPIINPNKAKESSEVLKKLGINVSNLEQAAGDINDVGKSSMGFNRTNPSEQAPENAQNTWDPALKIWLRGKLIPNWEEGSFKFSQDTDIPNAINQVILSSRYPEVALNNSENGFVSWWRIDTQIYYIGTDENLADTGKVPKIAVYRVVPYKVHQSKIAGSGTNVPGIDFIKSRAIKRYDYIFTGKNTEVIRFNIDYNVGFANTFASDAYLNSIGIVRQTENSVGDNQSREAAVRSQPAGAGPTAQDQNGAQRQQSREDKTGGSMDGAGGNATETQLKRLAITFHEAITNPYDMIMLDLEILGDPYWFATSGMGNYLAKPAKDYKDLNEDGSVGWQHNQVDVVVNFRTPVDINQTTGLYNFAGPNHMDMTKDPKAGPAIGFTGVYCVTLIKNHFRDGSFLQTLTGFRRGGQEYKKIATKENVLSPANTNPNNSSSSYYR